MAWKGVESLNKVWIQSHERNLGRLALITQLESMSVTSFDAIFINILLSHTLGYYTSLSNIRM